MKSKLFTLNSTDLLRGLLIAFLTALLTGLLELFQAGPFLFNWPAFQPIVYSAIAAAMAYLIKNLLTNGENKFLMPEKK
jgi:hypothetical protein